MPHPLVFPAIRLIGWAAAGFALGAGWKLGKNLVDVAMGEKDLVWPPKFGPDDKSGPHSELIKRKFTRIS